MNEATLPGGILFGLGPGVFRACGSTVEAWYAETQADSVLIGRFLIPYPDAAAAEAACEHLRAAVDDPRSAGARELRSRLCAATMRDFLDEQIAILSRRCGLARNDSVAKWQHSDQGHVVE